MASPRSKSGLAGVVAALLALVAPGSAAAAAITIPRGTAVDLVLENVLSSRTARVGDPFHATLAQALFIDGQLALPESTVVEGRVMFVASLRDGARSGLIGVKFVRLTLRGGGEPKREIDAKLTSLRQDDRRRLVGFVPGVAAAGRVEVFLIGRSRQADGRAHTLVGDGSLERIARSGVSETEVEVSAGTMVSMEFNEPLTVPRAAARALDAAERRIFVSPETVAAAQRELRERKRYRGEADGQLDADTRHAIILFQLDHQQEATGDLDEPTLRLLGLAPLALP